METQKDKYLKVQIEKKISIRGLNLTKKKKAKKEKKIGKRIKKTT
jgi:hypothetical protein